MGLEVDPDEIRKTTELTLEPSVEELEEVTYRPAPFPDQAGEESERPTWRVRFDMLDEPRRSFGLDINGELIFGRGGDGPNIVDMNPYNAEKLGVSRRHMMLRPTENKLFVLDLGSTNGTKRNAHSIGVNTPYSLSTGDMISLGRLQMMVRIINRPKSDSGMLRQQANLGDVLQEMVKSMTSQLELDAVLGQAVQAALTVTSSSETAIWLVDEESNELFLEAESGIGYDEIRQTRLPVSDSLVGRVLETGEPLIISRDAGSVPVEATSPSQTESMLYVPITLGGVTFGVLAAAHRESGKQFARQDQKVLLTLADFAAIAIQNSRTYQATEAALNRRVKELNAINEISRTTSASLDPMQVYNELTHQVKDHWDIEAVSLWMVDERTRDATVVSDTRNQGNRSQGTTGGSQQIVDRVVETGEPLLLSELKQDGELDINDTQEFKSELAVPIKLKDRVLAVLDLQSPNVNRFTRSDMETMQTVADQLGVAIHNAHLYRQIQRHADKLEQNVGQRTEDLYAANEQLEALSRLKDEFIANVSHQLRTPINSLKLLHDALRTAPPRRRDRFIETMRREINRLERTVEDLFKLSRLDQGQVALEPATFDLKELVHQYVNDRQSMAQNRNLTLTHGSEGNLRQVQADPGLIGQALSILLTNAFNYTPSGGAVRITSFMERDDGEAWAAFSVSDTGPGIPPEEQPYLFERFYRGSAAKNSQSPGAGLGLSIVKEIVELHEGRIEVESEGLPGKGATFTVFLPLEETYGTKLLLVDDDRTLLEVMHEILTSGGFEVQAALSGETALEAMEDFDQEGSLPDLIVTDVIMSGMTGIQLVEETRAVPEWAHIPFLFISASTTLAMEGQIAGLENVTFLRKPFDSETLQQTVTQAIEGHARVASDGSNQTPTQTE